MRTLGDTGVTAGGLKANAEGGIRMATQTFSRTRYAQQQRPPQGWKRPVPVSPAPEHQPHGATESLKRGCTAAMGTIHCLFHLIFGNFDLKATCGQWLECRTAQLHKTENDLDYFSTCNAEPLGDLSSNADLPGLVKVLQAGSRCHHPAIQPSCDGSVMAGTVFCSLCAQPREHY